MIIFSASEPGSVFSIAPLCNVAKERSIKFFITERGFFTSIKYPNLSEHFVNIDINAFKDFVILNKIKVLLFSVNIGDIYPLQLARIARNCGIYTIHLLDYWNGYSSRMRLDNRDIFHPDEYLVPDRIAMKSAISEGIKEETILISGNPNFSNLRDSFNGKELSKFKSENVTNLIFINEPVSLDHKKNYRGYDEKIVLRLLLSVLKNFESFKFYIYIVPHPRQETNEVNSMWVSLGGNKYGEVTNIPPRDLLNIANGVIGMSSTFLYESWLCGIPTLSLQPNLKINSLRTFENRTGIVFVDKIENSNKKILQWLMSLSIKKKYKYQEDLYDHEKSIDFIIDRLIKKL